jgi:hypothetical protein
MAICTSGGERLGSPAPILLAVESRSWQTTANRELIARRSRQVVEQHVGPILRRYLEQGTQPDKAEVKAAAGAAYDQLLDDDDLLMLEADADTIGRFFKAMRDEIIAALRLAMIRAGIPPFDWPDLSSPGEA